MRSKLLAVMTALLMGFSAVGPMAPKAAALDLFSSTMALGGAGMAVAGAIMMGQEGKKSQGTTLLIAGLAMSAVFSSSSVALNVLAMQNYDEIGDLELELAAGGGPIIDSLGAGFGIPSSEVLAAVRQARIDAVRSPEDMPAFTARLTHELSKRMEVSDEFLAQRFYALHAERDLLGTDRAVQHRILAEITGVPLHALAPMIAEALDGHLAARAEEGRIISARAVLRQNPRELFEQLAERLDLEYGDLLTARAGQHVAAFEENLAAGGI